MKRMSEMKTGETGRVKEITVKGDIKRRFIDIGLIEDTLVECVGHSPSKDPKAFLIRGAVIAIRNRDSDYIAIE